MTAMTNELRIVFDTNVVVSATMFPRSIPNRAMRTGAALGCVLASEETVDLHLEILVNLGQ